ncbi:MAG TPA: hypothetical protein VKB19_01260 [Pedobacter sp.]|nr:hypothetical protein [Pedobacter sp.]
MSFKEGLVASMHANLMEWNAHMNNDGDVVIIMKNGKPLKEQYDNFVMMIWFIMAEVPFASEKVQMIVTNESRTEEYHYLFDPESRKG